MFGSARKPHSCSTLNTHCKHQTSRPASHNDHVPCRLVDVCQMGRVVVGAMSMLASSLDLFDAVSWHAGGIVVRRRILLRSDRLDSSATELFIAAKEMLFSTLLSPLRPCLSDYPLGSDSVLGDQTQSSLISRKVAAVVVVDLTLIACVWACSAPAVSNVQF